MKKKNLPSKLSFEKFVKEVKLVAMGLNETSSHLERRSYMRARREKKEIKRTVAASFNLDDVGDNFFDAIAKYSLTVSGNDGEKPLSIGGTFEVHFHVPSPCDKVYAKRFVDEFLAIITWPYFRQLVFDTASRMSIAPITLPLIPETD